MSGTIIPTSEDYLRKQLKPGAAALTVATVNADGASGAITRKPTVK